MPISVVAGFRLVFIIVLAQSGTLRVFGTVVDPSGLPVTGAQIKLNSTSGAHLTAKTDSYGTFSRSIPGGGAYATHITAPVFADIRRQLHVSGSTGYRLVGVGLSNCHIGEEATSPLFGQQTV